jgi:hypothetical protein
MNYESTELPIENLINETIVSITNEDNRTLLIVCEHNTYEFYHMQDCCEIVQVYDIKGDLQSLEGKGIPVNWKKYSVRLRPCHAKHGAVTKHPQCWSAEIRQAGRLIHTIQGCRTKKHAATLAERYCR